MKALKCHYKIIEDNEQFCMVEWATKDGGGCKFYDMQCPHDFIEFYKIKKSVEDNSWKSHHVGRILKNNEQLSIFA